MVDKIIPMNAEEQARYDCDAEKYPWLKTVTMTDGEMLSRLYRCYTEKFNPYLFFSSWRDHYLWVFIAKVKHFFETGENVVYDDDYLDGQADYLFIQIMEADGADSDTIEDVLCNRKNYTFKNKK